MNRHLGLIYALAAYTIWGLVPIFWKQLVHVDSIEIVMHRMVWSCVLVVGLIVLMRQWSEFRRLLKQPQLLLRMFVASLLVSVNWAIFIWAVNAGYLVEASMGYFINPLISVLFGMLFFSETLRRVQWLALTVAALGVAYLIIAHGEVPYIALALAATFASYGAVKKTLKVPATHGMALETAFMVLPAAVYLLYLQGQGSGSFGGDAFTSVMLILGGLVTLTPLILFAAAAKLISMTTLGMSQYIGPTFQLLIGVFIYHEAFGPEKLISFGLIWIALLIYVADELNQQRVRRRARRLPTGNI